MESLKYNDGKIRLMINDDSSRVIAFAPEDVGFVSRYYELVDFIGKKQAEYIEKAEEIDKCSDNKDKDGLMLYKTMCEDIKSQIDYVFGEGTSQTVFGDSLRLDMFEQFLAGIVPFIKKARENKVKPYLYNTNGVL